jgi:hypothetical protein
MSFHDTDSTDDDYLSEKYLAELPSTETKTYSQRRKEAEKQARLNNERNRVKGRRERELEARREGLSRSLFERSKDEQGSDDKGADRTKNKALSIMMKMGFKPGQTLGKVDDEEPSTIASASSKASAQDAVVETPELIANTISPKRSPGNTNALHEPLPLNEWTGGSLALPIYYPVTLFCMLFFRAGKVGIGMRKRPPSPQSAERVSKMAKMAEEASHEAFRDRTRHDYEERRAEGRLVLAQRTCVTLDEKAGKSVRLHDS